MKKLAFVIMVLASFIGNYSYCQNYDFTAVASSGQTLYYRLINYDTEVSLVRPKNSSGGYLSEYLPSGIVIIPDSVQWMGVTLPVSCIGEYALAFSSITSVLIPNTIWMIEKYAFAGSSITEIEIPQSVNRIAEHSFSNCGQLRKVNILCTNALGWVNGGLPDLSNTNNIFFSCDNIEEVHYEQYIRIPTSNLRYLSFGDNIDTIPTSYRNCDHLKKVVIGNKISTIPYECFEDCDSLRIVVLGDSVSLLRSESFRKCTNLDTIYAKPSIAPALGTNVFNFTPPNKVVVTYCNADYATIWGTTGFNYHTADVFSISLNVNNTSYGYSIIVQAVDCNNTATISATPNQYYKFASWSDGDTNNPRTITLNQDTILTALFERDSFVVSTSSNNITMGNVDGNGVYNVDDSATLTAVAICGYRFNHWSNGSAENPLTFVPVSDTNIVAFFEIALDTIYIPDTTLETIVVYDTTIVPVTIYDTNVVIVPVFDTMELTIPIFDTVFFQVIDTTLAPIHDTLYIYDTIYFHDTIYIHDTIMTGMGDMSIVETKVYVSQGDIIIEGAHVDRIMLFDINGRLLGVRRSSGNGVVRFDVPASGTYVIKIGNNMTKKVVVIK